MKHIGTKTLETERLLLRKSTIDDADENDDNPEAQKNYLRQITKEYSKTNFYYWTIVEKEGNKAVGYICTINNDEKMLSCGMAYEIKGKYRNCGYASEALKRVLDFLLIEVEYNRVGAGHLMDNPASGRVMEKAGMRYEGTLRQDNRNPEGVLTDSKIYGILREDLFYRTDEQTDMQSNMLTDEQTDMQSNMLTDEQTDMQSDMRTDRQTDKQSDMRTDRRTDTPKQKLIIITGSPCVGKTAVAESLFESYQNCAYFDGDWAWSVNPFSIADPRLRNGDKTMSFALSTYLDSSFDYVIFSSVVVIGESIRKAILGDITSKDYETISFTLKCSDETLVERHKNRGDTNEVSFQWLRMESHPGDYVIDTDGKTVAQIVDEIKSIINSRGVQHDTQHGKSPR